jgi:hypothetical protein
MLESCKVVVTHRMGGFCHHIVQRRGKLLGVFNLIDKHVNLSSNRL